ncbi:RNA polymerase sigma factor [Arcobacter sp. F2176]|uniref:RNA polymerase sigma factor n=1 Tax=Arcobacter sp. F2176 TaxID=2044511 RepID=UPI00100B51CA|nr:RNA polymerase sigma factor [Arcobacter sp. F2176]RXJ80839.1 RNA polymerase subunit sigma [Arcobacter sp. F2176]
MLEYYKEISHYIKKLIKDEDLTKDLTQETYVKAIEIDKKTKKTIQKAYLYKIAYNLVVDKIRRNEKIVFTEYEEEKHGNSEIKSADEIITHESREEKLKKSLETLSKRNRQAFVLFVYKGYSRKEISEIMGISTNAVEKNITRSMLKIKSDMMKDD